MIIENRCDFHVVHHSESPLILLILRLLSHLGCVVAPSAALAFANHGRWTSLDHVKVVTEVQLPKPFLNLIQFLLHEKEFLFVLLLHLLVLVVQRVDFDGQSVLEDFHGVSILRD